MAPHTIIFVIRAVRVACGESAIWTPAQVYDPDIELVNRLLDPEMSSPNVLDIFSSVPGPLYISHYHPCRVLAVSQGLGTF